MSGFSPSPASIIGIGTAVPTTRLPQDAVRDLFAGQPGADRLTRRLVAAAFDQSAIDERHSVLPELAAPAGDAPVVAAGQASAFIDPDGRRILSPGTGVRNSVYVREAPALFAAAARDALSRAQVDAAEVTHVVTASCTGFFAPGPEFRLVRDLGLATTVSREHLGFLGCAAAVPALRSAARICAADPSAVVLVVCGEICTIHLRASSDPDQIVSSAVFADGAAAAVVTASAGGRRRLDLDRFATAITEDGEAAMGWTIGDEGFEMTLTAEVPRVVGREVRAALGPVAGDLLGGGGDAGDAAGTVGDAAAGALRARWAVHPGGRSILDRVEAACGLDAQALAPSRDVLRRYGNMSSATILFILQRLLDDADAAEGAPLVAVAFAPGLTVESARMTIRAGTSDAALAREPVGAVAAR